MIRFILDKGRHLKMSLKTLHLAVYIMDIFCEKTKPSFLKGENLVAACALLVAAKSGELDERIPFISKLKKYTELTNDPRDFKNIEVAIAEALQWNLQKVTFYSFVEFYLTAGVIVPQDRISKRMIDSLAEHGVEDTVRLLAREEQTRPRPSLDNLFGRPCTSSTRELPESKEEFLPLSSLTVGMRNDVIKVFELYARDLSNLVLREFKYWTYSKNTIAVSIILYTRAALLEQSGAWNGRLKDLCGVSANDVRDIYAKISEFICTGDKETIQNTVTPSLSSGYTTHNTALGPLAAQSKAPLHFPTTTQGPLSDLSSNLEPRQGPLLGKYSSYNYQSMMDREGMKVGAIPQGISSRSRDRIPHSLAEAANRRNYPGAKENN